MGVALENARLFDETQRLLKETEQRAAELAIINSMQQGVAAELDFQAIVRPRSATRSARCSKTRTMLGIRSYDHRDRSGPLPLRRSSTACALTDSVRAGHGRHVRTIIVERASRSSS